MIISTSLASKQMKYQAGVPAFSEFESSYLIMFILYYFHDYYDSVLGLKVLINLNLNNNLINKKLVCHHVEIPFKYRQ